MGSSLTCCHRVILLAAAVQFLLALASGQSISAESDNEFSLRLADLKSKRGSKGHRKMSADEHQARMDTITKLIVEYGRLISENKEHPRLAAAIRDLAELHSSVRNPNGKVDELHRTEAIRLYRQVLQLLPADKIERADTSLLLVQLLWQQPQSPELRLESNRLLSDVQVKFPPTATINIRARHLLVVGQVRNGDFADAEHWCRSLLSQTDADDVRRLREFQSLSTSKMIQATLSRKDLNSSEKTEWLAKIDSVIPESEEFLPLRQFAEKQLRISLRSHPDRTPIAAVSTQKTWPVLVAMNLLFLVGIMGYGIVRRVKSAR